MLTGVSMPSIFTPIPPEIERKAPGTGGKPPVDRRPTGGGGGGGDDEWRGPRHGPREALHRTRAFIFCALAGDMMFFVVLVTLFYARQASTHMDPETFTPDRRLASHPVAPDPFPQHRSASAQRLDHGTSPLSYLPRDRRVRGMARPGTPGAAPRTALGGGYPGPRPRYSSAARSWPGSN